MKKNLLLLLLTLLPLVASAHDIEVQNADGVTIYYNYTNDGTELAVTSHSYGYVKYSGDVVIPEEVTFMNRTRKVTSIGEDAFSACHNLTSVTIPNSVTNIGNNAFDGCSDLTYVTIGNSVTSIGAYAFRNCSNKLTSVSIPNSVTSIGDEAFKDCRNLKKVIVHDIAAWCKIVFSGYSSNPLCEAYHLYSDENTEIKDLIIPNSVTSIGSSAFIGCSGLTSVTIPNSVTSIGSWAFRGCSGLTSVTIPNSVTSIGESAFYKCYGLTSITIPSSVTSIESNAFTDCSGLTSVTIPNSVTSIGSDAFSGCSGLTSVTIPNSVTSIGSWAFSGCSGLTSITIPNSVTSIGSWAFNEVDILTVVSLIKNPFKIDGKTSYDRTFSQNTFNNATLYVPKGTIDKYKATEGWKDFFFIEEGNPVGINDDENTEYTLTYIVDGEEYKTYQIAEGSAITPEAAPTKDGYVFSGWSTIPATMPAEDVTITGTFTLLTDEDVIQITSAGQSTWCSKYDLDFTGVEGLKAYTATGYDRISGTIWLTRVYQVPANEGIFLMGNADEYHVPHKSTGTYYANLMVGTLQPITINETDGEYTNYYLSNGDSGVGFYKVNGSVDLKANRAYLPLLKGSVQAGTRFIGIEFEDDGTTNIKDLNPVLSEGEGAWYTLQGQRVAKPGKGLYIHNGHKVVIK